MAKTTVKTFMSVRETARASGLSEKFIRKQIKEGLVPGVTSGNKYLICYPDYLATLREGWAHD